MNERKKVAFITLGCKLNFAETSTISRLFSTQNFETVAFDEFADIYVINSCSVTSTADKKSRNLINKAKNNNPNAKIIVSGCYAQLKPDDVKNLGVDYVVGTQNNSQIKKIIEEICNENFDKKNERNFIETKFFGAYSKGDRTRSFLKIQDGCDYFCSYCTIPFARGRSRSATIQDVLFYAEKIVESGIKEIILTGINLGEFGKNSDENLIFLLEKLVLINGIERIRISSIEPNLLTNEIIDFVANNSKIMPHFHIPLQSGCDEMLKLMNRRYTTDFFRKKIETVKQKIPDSFIGIDLICGLNGETNDFFKKSLEFVDSLDITFIHEFQYSERPNTKALNFLPKINPKEKHKRALEINLISNKKHIQFYKNNIGKEKFVLFESAKKNNKIYGFTDNYIKVETEFNPDLVNKIVAVKLLKISDNMIFSV